MAELPLDPGAPGGQVPYRRALTLSLFFKSYLTSLVQLGFQLPPEKLSGTKTLKTLRPESSQYFQIVCIIYLFIYLNLLTFDIFPPSGTILILQDNF